MTTQQPSTAGEGQYLAVRGSAPLGDIWDGIDLGGFSPQVEKVIRGRNQRRVGQFKTVIYSLHPSQKARMIDSGESNPPRAIDPRGHKR